MDGYDVSKELRQLYEENSVPQPKIVACTGHVEEDYIKRAWLYSIDEVLPKPINPDILRKIVDECLQFTDGDNGEWRYRNHSFEHYCSLNVIIIDILNKTFVEHSYFLSKNKNKEEVSIKNFM